MNLIIVIPKKRYGKKKWNNVTSGQKVYAARMMQIEKQREESYKSLGTPPGVPTMKGATADPDNTGYGYNSIIGETEWPLCGRRLGATAETQFGYGPSSVYGLTSTSVANSFSEITPAWVQGLKDATGSMPYAEGGSTNIGLIPVNVNPTRDTPIQAYPWKAAVLRQLPENYNMRTLLRRIL